MNPEEGHIRPDTKIITLDQYLDWRERSISWGPRLVPSMIVGEGVLKMRGGESNRGRRTKST